MANPYAALNQAIHQTQPLAFPRESGAARRTPTIARAPVNRRGVIGPGVPKLGGTKPAPPPPPMPGATDQLAGGGQQQYYPEDAPGHLTHAQTGTPAAPPAAPDFTSYITGDQRWIGAQGPNTANANNLNVRYGLHPIYQTNPDGSLAKDQYGNLQVSHYEQDNPADNPNSIINQITKGAQGTIASQQNAQNAHGLLFSGATAAQAGATQSNTARAINDQLLNHQQGMNNLATDQQNLINTIYNDWLGKAGTLGADQTQTAPAAAPAGTPGGPSDVPVTMPKITPPKAPSKFVETIGQKRGLPPNVRPDRAPPRGAHPQRQPKPDKAPSK